MKQEQKVGSTLTLSADRIFFSCIVVDYDSTGHVLQFTVPTT